MSFTIALSPTRVPLRKNFWLFACLAAFTAVWIDSLVGTNDLKNWLLENTLVFFLLGFLIATYRRHPFSNLSYLLIFAFLSVHVYGSKFTYAENPFGYWLQDLLHSKRNFYDRVVHFGFGLLLTYPTREMLLRWWKFPAWVGWWLPIELTLSFSTLYELVEWLVAEVLFKEQGPAYLGTQGDVWDAHKDIALAVVGALLAMGIVALLKKAVKKI